MTSKAWADRVATLKPLAVVSRDEGDLVAAVTAAIGAPALEVVADVVGGPQFPDYLALLGPKGRYVTAGAIAGPVVALDLRTIYLKRLILLGVSIGYRHHFEAVLGYIRSGKIRPLLARTYPLSEIRQAQTDFMAKGFFGNLVVLPGT